MVDPAFCYIDSALQIQDMIRQIGAEPEIAIDTEADSLHHYYEKVCLIQLSVGASSFIVDPLSGIDMSPLLSEIDSKRLILHGADYDLRMLRLSFGFELRGELFDTMLAAQMLGYKELGLAALVKRFFGIELAKHGQKADWSKRPLPDKLLEYACGDTLYLHQLAKILESELERLGRREWHREACRQVIRVAAQDNNRRDPASEWRIKGSSQLSPYSLAVLREIWGWRDAEAQKADLPPFKVLGNQGLLDLAIWAKDNPHASLERWPGLPRRYHARRLANLKSALHRARSNSHGEIFEGERENRYAQNGHEEKALVEALRRKRDAIAARLDLEPAILAPRAVLAAVSRNKPQIPEQFREIDRMLSWQINVLANEFIDVINEHERLSESEEDL